MWRYDLALPFLLPVIAILRYLPRSVAAGAISRAALIGLGIWIGATMAFAMFLWFGAPKDFFAESPTTVFANAFAALVMVLGLVLFVPIATASVLLGGLMRIGVSTWLSITLAAIGASAMVFILPWLFLFGGCLFFDRSCI